MADDDKGYPQQISRMALLRGRHLLPSIRDELTGGTAGRKVLKDGQFVRPDATLGRPLFGDPTESRKRIENDPAMEFTPAYPEPGLLLGPGKHGVIPGAEILFIINRCIVT